ncbi:hypothetical protein GGI12_000794 [Dipsacomyces acuminosporus]|nr:hypothetical protein GGI12_000794 [Dipsacomyces acuminosporus]
MQIRQFNRYIKELKLIQETRLNALADTRLGIEGYNWLKQVLDSLRTGEPVAMGGYPLALEAEIAKELAFFRKNSITPIFVFSGLPIARKDNKVFATDDHRTANRNSAWGYYWQKHTEQAMRGWSTSVPQSHALTEAIPFVMRVLQAHGAEVLRAPYSSWGQLAYLYKHESQPIHAVYAPSDILMFDIDRVITAINHSKSTFSWVLKDNLLHNFGIGHDQFLDMCILAGFEWCPTFPAIDSEVWYSFKSAIDVIRTYRTGFNAIQAYAEHPVVKSSNYVDNYCRTYCAIRYHIVLQLDGTVGPLNAEYAPNDLHEIIGYRLPNAAYQLLARGIIHPPMLSVLTSGAWAEFPPLDNGESEEYRDLVVGWMREIYTSDYSALCNSLGPFFKQRKVVMRTWIDPQSEFVLHEGTGSKASSGSPIVTIAASATNVPQGSNISAILQRSKDLVQSRPKAKGPEAQTSGKTDSPDTEVILSALSALGFVSSSGQHTKLGSALLAGLRSLQGDRASSPTFQWALVSASILLERGLLSGEKWSVAYEDNSAPVGDANQQKHVRLISRIAALLAASERTGPWKLPFNRDLLAFSSAVKLVLKTATSVIESACLIQNVGSPALSSESLGKLAELRSSIPLDGATNDASGLLVYAVLSEHVQSGNGSWERIQETIGNSISNPKGVLDDVWSLVAAVAAITKEYCSGSKKSEGKTSKTAAIPKAAAGDMKSAYEWAAPIFGKILK